MSSYPSRELNLIHDLYLLSLCEDLALRTRDARRSSSDTERDDKNLFFIYFVQVTTLFLLTDSQIHFVCADDYGMPNFMNNTLSQREGMWASDSGE